MFVPRTSFLSDATSHFLRSLVLQVGVPPLHQVQATDASEGFDVAHCTQIPVTHARTIYKRLRKERQCKALAYGGETPPNPHRSSRSKKLTTSVDGFADQTLQTPMLESDAPSEFGPPPPDSSPAPERGKCCDSVPALERFQSCDSTRAPERADTCAASRLKCAWANVAAGTHSRRSSSDIPGRDPPENQNMVIVLGKGLQFVSQSLYQQNSEKL